MMQHISYTLRLRGQMPSAWMPTPSGQTSSVSPPHQSTETLSSCSDIALCLMSGQGCTQKPTWVHIMLCNADQSVPASIHVCHSSFSF